MVGVRHKAPVTFRVAGLVILLGRLARALPVAVPAAGVTVSGRVQGAASRESLPFLAG